MLRVTVLRAPRRAFGFQSECLESKKTIVRFANLATGRRKLNVLLQTE